MFSSSEFKRNLFMMIWNLTVRWSIKGHDSVCPELSGTFMDPCRDRVVSTSLNELQVASPPPFSLPTMLQKRYCC
jgi:hypothetical protein